MLVDSKIEAIYHGCADPTARCPGYARANRFCHAQRATDKAAPCAQRIRWLAPVALAMPRKRGKQFQSARQAGKFNQGKTAHLNHVRK